MSRTLWIRAAALGGALLLAGPGRAETPAGIDPSLKRSPYVCAAQWAHTTPSCSLPDPVVVRAAGKSQHTARKGAVNRLRLTLASLSQAAVLDAQGTFAAVYTLELVGCANVAETDMMVTCLPTPSYLNEGICFAELPYDACWDERSFSAIGRYWQASEGVRAQACGALEGKQDARTLRCLARCQTSLNIRCVSD